MLISFESFQITEVHQSYTCHPLHPMEKIYSIILLIGDLLYQYIIYILSGHFRTGYKNSENLVIPAIKKLYLNLM